VTKKQVLVGSLLFMFVVASKGPVLGFASKNLLLLVYYSGQRIITPLPGCYHKALKLNDFLLLSFGRRCARVVFAHVLTEWRRFQFWYHPREALNSGLSASFFAFIRSINPLTAIPERYKEVNFTFSGITTKHLITKHFVMMLLESDQSEVPVLATESKHEARESNNYKRTKVWSL